MGAVPACAAQRARHAVIGGTTGHAVQSVRSGAAPDRALVRPAGYAHHDRGVRLRRSRTTADAAVPCLRGAGRPCLARPAQIRFARSSTRSSAYSPCTRSTWSCARPPRPRPLERTAADVGVNSELTRRSPRRTPPSRQLVTALRSAARERDRPLRQNANGGVDVGRDRLPLDVEVLGDGLDDLQAVPADAISRWRCRPCQQRTQTVHDSAHRPGPRAGLAPAPTPGRAGRRR